MPPKKNVSNKEKRLGVRGRGRHTLPQQDTAPPDLPDDVESDSDHSRTEEPQTQVEVDGDEPVKMGFEEKIADFFEDHKHFYNMSSPDFKNKLRRNTELAELAAVLGHGWTGEGTINLLCTS